MDPIELFIRSNKRFSLHALLKSHSILTVLQAHNSAIVFEDVVQSLSMSGVDMSFSDLNAHAALVYESSLVPVSGSSNRPILQMNRDIVGNVVFYLKNVLNVVYSRCEGVEYNAVEEFNMEAFLYLKHRQGSVNASSPAVVGNQYGNPMNRNIVAAPAFGNGGRRFQTGISMQPSMPPSRMAGHSMMQQQQPQFPINQYAPGQHQLRNPMYSVPQDNGRRFPQTAPRKYNPCDQQDEYGRPTGRVEFEKSEPIVRLLAQVRKVGMDILFPQCTHDKILVCIYVAICASSTPAHRELIDMVMAVKESNLVSHLENVSKTKVRGVLALLKHGELLVTQGSEGEPVRLLLSPEIASFKDLREKHDSFLNRYLAEHHLFIPTVLKSELVWQFDSAMMAERLSLIDRFVVQLQSFFKGYQSLNMERSDSDSGSGQLSDDIQFIDESDGESAEWINAGKLAAHTIRKQQNSANHANPDVDSSAFAGLHSSFSFKAEKSNSMTNQPIAGSGLFGSSQSIFVDRFEDNSSRLSVGSNYSNWMSSSNCFGDVAPSVLLNSKLRDSVSLSSIELSVESSHDSSVEPYMNSHSSSSLSSKGAVDHFAHNNVNTPLDGFLSNPHFQNDIHRFDPHLGSSLFS